MGRFEIFDDSGRGKPTDLSGMLNWINESIEDGKISITDAINTMIDMVRPGTSDNSHDVKPLWVGAMYAYGYGPVTEKVAAMYLNFTNWGMGFAISVEEGFEFEALSEDARHAVIKALCVVLQSGGLNATVTENFSIRIEDDDGTTSDLSTDDLIGQFRVEIDKELGPDALVRDPDNPMRRWLP